MGNLTTKYFRMKNYLFLIALFSVFLFGCKNKSLQLAEVPTANITHIIDHSPAYISINLKDSSANLNRKNLISTTNWILHIDKNLSLAKVVPHLRFLYQKRYSKSMHSNAQAETYFSVSNAAIKKISFLRADSLKIMPNNLFSKNYVTDHPEEHMPLHTLRINFGRDRNTTIDGIAIPTEEVLSYIIEQKDFSAPNKTTRIYANFEETLNFQDFINGYYLLQKLNTPKIEISKRFFIYNQDSIPDCGCKL